MCHVSCVMCHVSCVMCHVSCVICPLTTTLCSFSCYESSRMLGDETEGGLAIDREKKKKIFFFSSREVKEAPLQLEVSSLFRSYGGWTKLA